MRPTLFGIVLVAVTALAVSLDSAWLGLAGALMMLAAAGGLHGRPSSSERMREDDRRRYEARDPSILIP